MKASFRRVRSRTTLHVHCAVSRFRWSGLTLTLMGAREQCKLKRSQRTGAPSVRRASRLSMSFADTLKAAGLRPRRRRLR
jgi:hypothetical protein